MLYPTYDFLVLKKEKKTIHNIDYMLNKNFYVYIIYFSLTLNSKS